LWHWFGVIQVNAAVGSAVAPVSDGAIGRSFSRQSLAIAGYQKAGSWPCL
jgi:hypothetical protein